MFEMAKNSITLFLQGRLFKDINAVMRQALIGIVITAAIVIGMSFAGLPLWLAAALGGFVGGVAQPILFKDLKYA